MKKYLFISSMIMALCFASFSSEAGFGNVLKQVTNKTGTSTGTSVEYQNMENKQNQADAKSNEIDSYVNSFMGKNYQTAVSSTTSKVGVQPVKNDKFVTKWLITTYEPKCVLVKMNAGPDGNVNSASAWNTGVNEGNTCQHAFGSANF